MKQGKIVMLDYYGQYESIQGAKRLPQTVLVEWPDGTKETASLKGVEGRGTAQVDMNNYPDHFTTRTLFVVIDVHGLKIEVGLNKLKFWV